MMFKEVMIQQRVLISANIQKISGGFGEGGPDVRRSDDSTSVHLCKHCKNQPGGGGEGQPPA